MPTHEELPDPDAWWRLTGAEGPAPSRQARESGRPAAAQSPVADGASRADAPKSYDLPIVLVVLAALSAVAIDAVGSDPIYDAVAWFVDYMNSGPGFPQVVAFIFVGAIPVTLLHELGHALAARALLGTPVSVAIGSVGELAQLRLGEISITINAFAAPVGVAGSASFDASRATARDILLIALAGPAASAAGLVVAILAFDAAPATGIIHGLAWGAVGASIVGVLNLIPITFEERRNGPKVQTDGRLALDAVRVMHALHAR